MGGRSRTEGGLGLRECEGKAFQVEWSSGGEGRRVLDLLTRITAAEDVDQQYRESQQQAEKQNGQKHSPGLGPPARFTIS